MLLAQEFPIAAEQFGYKVIPLAEKEGAPLGWVASSPTAANVTTAAVVNGPPHPYAAMLMLKYMASEKGNQIIANYGRVPVNPRAKSPFKGMAMWQEKDMLEKLIPVTPQALTPEKQKVTNSIIKDLVESQFRK